MSYKIEATIFDGGQVKTLYGDTASLKISESDLWEWNKGTRTSRQASVEYHFTKHAREVGAKNIPQYLRAASSYRNYMINLINKDDLKLIRVTDSYGYTKGAKKYTSTVTGRYVIFDTSHLILSFGGKL